MKRILLTLVPILIIAGLGWFLLSPKNDEVNTPLKKETTEGLVPFEEKATKEFATLSEEQKEQSNEIIIYQSQCGPLPKSLEGVPIPNTLLVDEDGNLIIQGGLRRLFNFFLTTVGEEPLETVLARIEEHIKNQLEPPAEGQALEIFFRFVEMKKAIIDMQQTMAADFKASEEMVDFRYHFEEARAIQRSFLGDEVYEAFYADKERMDNYMMDLLDIQRDPDLTEEEKYEKRIAIEAQLPERSRVRREETRLYEDLNNSINEARAQGATEEEIFQIRSEVLGAEKAERFRQADAKQSAWQSRVDDYRGERDIILDNDSLSETDKAHAIDALRQDRFSGGELIRIDTIDKRDLQ